MKRVSREIAAVSLLFSFSFPGGKSLRIGFYFIFHLPPKTKKCTPSGLNLSHRRWYRGKKRHNLCVRTLRFIRLIINEHFLNSMHITVVSSRLL